MDCLCPFSKIIKLLPSVPRESSGAHRLGSLFVLDGWHGEWSRKDAGLFANFQGQISFFRGCGRFCQCNKPLSFISIRVFSIFQYLFLPTLNSSLHFASNELFSKRQENSSPATHFLVWNFSDGLAILGGWLGWITFVGLESRFTSTNWNRNTFNFIFVNPFFLSQTLTRSRRKAFNNC